MTDRCEPPPELRNNGGWHWLRIEGVTPIAVFWDAECHCWYGPVYRSAVLACSYGWRYHAPIPDPPAKPYRWNEEA